MNGLEYGIDDDGGIKRWKMVIEVDERRIRWKKWCAMMMGEENFNNSGDKEDETTLLDDKITVGRLVAKKRIKDCTKRR